MPIQTYAPGSITAEQIAKLLSEGWTSGGMIGVNQQISGLWGGQIYAYQLVSPERDIATGKNVYMYVPERQYGEALAIKTPVTQVTPISGAINLSGSTGYAELPLTSSELPYSIQQAFTSPNEVTTPGQQNSTRWILLLLTGFLILKEVKL